MTSRLRRIRTTAAGDSSTDAPAATATTSRTRSGASPTVTVCAPASPRMDSVEERWETGHMGWSLYRLTRRRALKRDSPRPLAAAVAQLRRSDDQGLDETQESLG